MTAMIVNIGEISKTAMKTRQQTQIILITVKTCNGGEFFSVIIISLSPVNVFSSQLPSLQNGSISSQLRAPLMAPLTDLFMMRHLDIIIKFIESDIVLIEYTGHSLPGHLIAVIVPRLGPIHPREELAGMFKDAAFLALV